MGVVVAATVSGALASCAQVASPEPTPTPVEATVEAYQPPAELPAPEPEHAPLYEWNGKGRAVTHIEVNVDRQKAVFYSGDDRIGWTTVASGVRSYPTPTGRYTIQEKIVDKRSNLYGTIYNSRGRVVRRNAERGVHPIPPGGRFEGARMPYFMRMSGDGIGMHAGPLPSPGSPASHGCVRMPHSLAPIVFRHVDIGTTVSVVGSGPSYAQYMAAERREAARRAKKREAASVEAVAATADGPRTAPEASASAPSAEAGAATADGLRTAPEASAPAPATPDSRPEADAVSTGAPAGAAGAGPSEPAENRASPEAAASAKPKSESAPAPRSQPAATQDDPPSPGSQPQATPKAGT